MGGREAGGGGGGGREGDWECNGCGNRNYAFRSFCNRCKQPRLLVDTKTPPDSKWLPRIGDWICTGCTNNNYASREKCKKCGEPKEVAAMPAIPIPGASVATHPNYFSRVPGGPGQNVALQQPLPLSWSLGVSDNYDSLHGHGYGLHPASTLPSGGSNTFDVSFAGQTTQAFPKGWRNGDWICPCGFHNYSSREQCKKCNASMSSPAPLSSVSTAVTAIGTKRLASEELVSHWDNKRLNAGHTFGHEQSYSVVDSAGPGLNLPSSIYPTYSSGVPGLPSNVHLNLPLPHIPAVPALLGKGAKQWRSGDWMCTNCNNHNYASRSHCNRCKTEREVLAESVTVA